MCGMEAVGAGVSIGAYAMGVLGVMSGPPGWVALGVLASAFGAAFSTGALINCLGG